MSHQCRHGQMVMALDKFSGGKSVPRIVASHTLAGSFGKPMKAIAQSPFRPRAKNN